MYLLRNKTKQECLKDKFTSKYSKTMDLLKIIIKSYIYCNIDYIYLSVILPIGNANFKKSNVKVMHYAP